jgi:hypothetical protein
MCDKVLRRGEERLIYFELSQDPVGVSSPLVAFVAHRNPLYAIVSRIKKLE